MSLESEVENIPELMHVGKAIVQYIRALYSKRRFRKEKPPLGVSAKLRNDHSSISAREESSHQPSR